MKDYNFDGKHEVEDYPKFEELEEELNTILEEKVSHISISEKGKLEFHKGIHIVIDNCNNKKDRLILANRTMIKLKRFMFCHSQIL